MRSSDGEGEFGDGLRDPMPRVDINAEFVMSAVGVLDEGVSCADHFGRAHPFKTAHRPHPGFQATVICFNRVIQVLPYYMTAARQQLVEYSDRRVPGR